MIKLRSKQQIIDVINNKFLEERVCERLDEEMAEWLDDDWEDNFETEYEAYQEIGRGQAEDAVRAEIYHTILKDYSISPITDLNEIINEIFPVLNKS